MEIYLPPYLVGAVRPLSVVLHLLDEVIGELLGHEGEPVDVGAGHLGIVLVDRLGVVRVQIPTQMTMLSEQDWMNQYCNRVNTCCLRTVIL